MVDTTETTHNGKFRRRVCLVAFGCSPYVGSEPGLGWHRIREIARHHDAVVICEASSVFRANIERYLAENGPVAGLEFRFVPVTPWELRIRPIPGMYYVAYRRWQRRAYHLAAELHRERPFDLIHHVNLGTYREPGFPWELEIPIVWGPVGGTQNLPWRFLFHNGPVPAFGEMARSLSNILQMRFSPRVRKAAHCASALVASSSTAQRDFQRVHGIDTTLICDCGTNPTGAAAKAVPAPDRPLHLLWLGPFQSRKALNLLLLALARLPRDIAWELRIVGDGGMESRWRSLAERLGLSGRCQWMGRVPHEVALAQYAWADVFVFTSLRDTVAAVVLEALGHGVPIIGLDHQGVHDVITADCGIRIPVTDVNGAVQGFADAIAHLNANRGEIAHLSQGALERAQLFCWGHNGDRMEEVYRRVFDGRKENL